MHAPAEGQGDDNPATSHVGSTRVATLGTHIDPRPMQELFSNGAAARPSATAPIPEVLSNPFMTPLSDNSQAERARQTQPNSLPADAQKLEPSYRELHLASWNIGGTSIEDAVQATKRASERRKDIICFQEVPRRPTGWHTDLVDDMTVVQYRHDDDQWRGNAIAFSSECQILRRRGCRFGIWLRLRHAPTQNELWIASLRLSTGTTSDVTAEELQNVCSLLPPTLLPVIMLGDYNTQLRWTHISGTQGDLRPTEARSEYLLSQLGSCGMRMKAPTPDQWDIPTSRPRRTKAKGRQIDGIAYKGTRLTDVVVEIDSCKQIIGGDHERISTSLLLREGDRPPPHRVPTGPRVVIKQPPKILEMNQQTLQQLASSCTAPKPSSRYKDTTHVKALYKHAKQTGSDQAWKEAHKARRKAQEQWRKQKLEKAAQVNWQEYRSLKIKGGSEWTVHFVQAAEDKKQDPKRWTVNHFKQLFQQAEPRNQPRWTKAIDTGEHFSLEELREALQRGKRNKSVGEDMVSFELIHTLCEDSDTELAFLAWMERLRGGESLPEQWLRTIVTLLPKTEKPRGPGDLRPISIGSSAAKVFGTMLLLRTRRVIQPLGPAQCAHNGRQTSDYLYAAIRTFSLDTEWKMGLSWCRIDIRKAFDTLASDRTLQILRDRLPPSMFMEFKCWERLFNEGTALLRTPWGDESIPQGRGIRQGSVESPFLFAIAVETALYDAMAKPTWPRIIPAAPDMPVAELLFMDDTLLCSSTRDTMVTKYNILKEELQKWGLRVNPEKTAYYCSPHSTTPGPIKLDDETIHPMSSLTVFGIPLTVPLKPTTLMDSAMAKASKKFYANIETFTARAPLRGKLSMFRSIVAGAALWCASAITPTPQAMSSLNTLQMELISKAAGFRRKSHETWLDFRMRSLRSARSLMHTHAVERWSTTWLRRYWAYKGHIARALDRTHPPASSCMDSYRTLAWWRDQQSRPDGIKHTGTFFAYRTHEEEALNKASNNRDWRSLAKDPQAWKDQQTTWVNNMDLAWSSGRQLALPSHQ